MIRTIHVRGFKSLAEETLELGRVNCFIGANGVGKSNILEAIGILGAAASGRVDDEAIARRGVRAGLSTSLQDLVREREDTLRGAARAERRVSALPFVAHGPPGSRAECLTYGSR